MPGADVNPFVTLHGGLCVQVLEGSTRVLTIDYIESWTIALENLLFKRLKVWPLVTERLFGNQRSSSVTVRGEQV